MVDYKQILRLRAEGVSQRGIADVLGCSRNTVAAVFAAANAAGVGFGEVADLGADEVRHLLLPEPAKAVSGRVTPDFEHVHRELARPSVTLLLLWNEYVAGCRAAGGVPYRYSFFNEQYRRWVASTGASMHVQRSPGESIEVDWAGDAMPVADPLTGARVDAWLFVAALSFSAYAYVEAFTDMTLGSWIDAHVHAFEAFGGTARLLVPDNLRTGVSRSDRYEPALNPAYARMAEHYGTAIVPARVRRPRDKPVVEGSVRFVANQVAAVLRDRRFVGLAELNEAIFDEVAEINARPFQKREDSRRIVFARDEKPLLRPLPPMRFELADLRKAKARARTTTSRWIATSTPCRPQLIGQSLDVRVTSHTIEVFAGAERVACHTTAHAASAAATPPSPSTCPPGIGTGWSTGAPQRFEQWAATIGPDTVAAIQAILASRKIAEQSYRSCLGVMSLARKPGGMVRLEDSCGRALAATPSPSYTLIKKLWAAWQPADPPPAASLGEKGFVRGSRYYVGRGPGMIDVETLSRLKAMRLSGMAEYFENLAAATGQNNTLTGPEMVKMAVDWEYERRRNSKLHRLRRHAALAQPDADIADIKAMPGRSVDTELIARLAVGSYLQQAPGRDPAGTDRGREDLRGLRAGQQGLPAVPHRALPAGRGAVRPHHHRRTHRGPETLPRCARQASSC